jgi:predicted transcriptional regulator
MTCEVYSKYDVGDYSESDFKNHVQTCPICRELAEQDEQLLFLAKKLRQPIEAPTLWPKIENSLRFEQQKRKQFVPGRHKAYRFMQIAAALMIAIGIGSYFFLKDRPEADQEGRLLVESALENVEQKERGYESAILELEKIAIPHMEKLDIEFTSLYQERLVLIDEQINKCKEALETNPANAHIHRYLIVALQDKKETLEEIFNQTIS